MMLLIKKTSGEYLQSITCTIMFNGSSRMVINVEFLTVRLNGKLAESERKLMKSQYLV